MAERRVTPDRPKLLIAICGRQHADQLAAATVEAGWETLLCHTTPVRPELGAVLAGHHRLQRTIGLISRSATRLLPPDLAKRITYAMHARFDRSVARALSRTAPTAVIVYENCALETLKEARRLGLPTILDAASVHHHRQVETDADTRFRAAINARKDAEIALSDHIMCSSAFAAQSYIDAGVPADRIHTVPLGFDAGAFGPDMSGAIRSGPLRIAFVARLTKAKGADLLEHALATLARQGIPFECRIAASTAESDGTLVTDLARHATLMGKVPHSALAELYRWADILVMPSRFDSFGLVVVEALACGSPVLCSDHAGAASMIVPGENGDIFPSGDITALTATLIDYAVDPAKVRAMRPAAVASARGADWPTYRRRVAATLSSILGAPDR